MSTAQSRRLSRLLALVPYFSTRGGISMEKAASDLGVTPAQLRKDLEQLFVCGLPGYYPDDLIELEFSEGYVDVGFTAGMDRPLRLTGAEASVLLVALQALVDMAGVLDQQAARRAIAKIEQAVGKSLPAVATVSVDDDEKNPTYATVRQAVTEGRALDLTYYSATRDSVSQRVVDPIRLQGLNSNTYLEAWCRGSEGVRLFRFDRIEAAQLRDEPSTPPASVAGTQQSVLLGDDPDHRSVEIEIDPEQAWVLDYYRIDPLDDVVVAKESDEPIRGRLAYGSLEWLTRFLLGFGGTVRVVDDREIDDAVTNAAHAARARYR
ncbi:helix-turn-helix transcriptional regulator [Gordonia sputi]